MRRRTKRLQKEVEGRGVGGGGGRGVGKPGGVT